MSHSSNLEKEKARLRQYLNPSIQGTNTDTILESLAPSTLHLIDTIEAVDRQLYIATAKLNYLDQLLADRNIIRPEKIGMSDEIFSELGIEVANRKQIRSLINKVLEIMYGYEFTRSTMESNMVEPYSLENGDTLMIKFDDTDEIEIPFLNSQFSDINNATAQEVSDIITKYVISVGGSGSAVVKDDGLGNYVLLVSNTIGNSSSISVTGGKAQNVLKFKTIRPTSGDASTQWTVDSNIGGGSIRMTWSGGATPSVGKVRVGDYVNIYSPSFNELNKGRFFITAVKSGTIGNAYVEFINVLGVSEVVTQGDTDGVLFFNPERATIFNKLQYATTFCVEEQLLEIFIPATTKVIRRDRIGAAHLPELSSLPDGTLGPYIYDLSQPFTVGCAECNTTEIIDSTTGALVQVDDASEFPDEEGFIIFGYGTSKQEGPIPYIARPSDNILLINSSYVFEKEHSVDTNISIVSSNLAANINPNGSDYSFYITDVISGRLYVEQLINDIKASGIKVIINTLYPSDVGLGKWGDEVYSEKFMVWGDDKV